MTMHLYELFCFNMQIQYKGNILSKAMLFIIITNVLNLSLPFIVAVWSKEFWFKSFSAYEQPAVRFTYEYLLVAETGDMSRPVVCREGQAFSGEIFLSGGEICADIQVEENDNNNDGLTDLINIMVHIVVPEDNSITSLLLILGLDYRISTVYPLHMQSLAVITKEFSSPPCEFRYFGDVQLSQITHMPNASNLNSVDTRYNTSLFDVLANSAMLVFDVDTMIETYFRRDVTTYTKPIFMRSKNGQTGYFDMKFSLRVPQSEILYTPSLIEELIWAWPYYLSLYIVFYFMFDRIKKFVFTNRLVMAWEVVPVRNDVKELLS